MRQAFDGVPPMSNPNDLEWPSDAIEVGCIVDAWGIKGGFKVQPLRGRPAGAVRHPAMVHPAS